MKSLEQVVNRKVMSLQFSGPASLSIAAYASACIYILYMYIYIPMPKGA